MSKWREISLVRETSRLRVKLHCFSFCLTWSICHHKFVYVLTHIISQIMETSNFITSNRNVLVPSEMWHYVSWYDLCNKDQASKIFGVPAWKWCKQMAAIVIPVVHIFHVCPYVAFLFILFITLIYVRHLLILWHVTSGLSWPLFCSPNLNSSSAHQTGHLILVPKVIQRLPCADLICG